mgnify:CR=1 FL=1
MKKVIVGIFYYDLDSLSIGDKMQISQDFDSIKESIIRGKPTQKGQKSLHIARHSNGGNDDTRALAFTNKFLTKLISGGLNLKLEEKGRSSYFNL